MKLKLTKQYLLGVVGGFLFTFSLLVNAQDTQGLNPGAPNTLESIAVAQQGGVLNVRLAFKEPLAVLPPGFSVSKPARIAFDFSNTANGLGKSSQTYNQGDLKSVNIASAEGRTRLVLNLNRAMNYESSLDGNNLLLVLSPSVEKDSRKGGVVPQVEHFAPSGQSATLSNIRDISFRRGQDAEGRITVDLSDPNVGIDLRQEGKSLVIDFVKITVPESLRKRLDVTDFATPVLSVNTVQHGANARMTIASRGLWEHNAYQTDNQFVVEVKPIIENPNKLVQGTRGGYQGEKLSLNFQNVDVRRLLQVIGEFTGMNMVVSDSVAGSITLVLKDVAWDQALDIIMRQKGLDMRKNGNVILIAPREEINTKEKLEFEAKAQINDLAPLETENFQLNYVKGEDLRRVMIDPRQTMLSKRGSVLIDNRTNYMFVTDVPERLEKVRNMIAKIDIPVRQVMIEARIVEAGDSFSRNLGVRLNTGAMIPNGAGGGTMVPAFTTPSTSTVGLALAPNDALNVAYGGGVNLPSFLNANRVLGLALFNSKHTRYISAEISALEADGRGKVISSPRVMTANQTEALIEQGVEIPYQQATSSGATSVSFKKANLSLKVKPQITPDGKITMTLDINKDTPSAEVQSSAGIGIDTKHVKTEVLIENGGTVVIGGIYTQTIRQNTQKVPLFGDIPYIGWLFKTREWIDNKTELLVFITPKVVVESLAIR